MTDKEKTIKELKETLDSLDITNKYRLNLIRAIEYLQEEPVSGLDNGDMSIERWKQAVAAASNQKNYRSNKGLTETRDDYFVDGVQWADEHPKEDPVIEELEDAATKSANKATPYTRVDVGNGEVYVYTKHIVIDRFKAGAKWQIEKLMKDATEVTVHIEAGNYPFIPKLELYDYDKDIPLAKEGDKYKVVLIKED